MSKVIIIMNRLPVKLIKKEKIKIDFNLLIDIKRKTLEVIMIMKIRKKIIKMNLLEKK